MKVRTNMKYKAKKVSVCLCVCLFLCVRECMWESVCERVYVRECMWYVRECVVRECMWESVCERVYVRVCDGKKVCSKLELHWRNSYLWKTMHLFKKLKHQTEMLKLLIHLQSSGEWKQRQAISFSLLSEANLIKEI